MPIYYRSNGHPTSNIANTNGAPLQLTRLVGTGEEPLIRGLSSLTANTNATTH